jgi:hypothetical protein
MIAFKNPGLIPLEGVFTMGLHVKVGKNPIGFFGTGLKLSIGTILRLGGTVTIFRGLDRLDFFVKNKEVRGKNFEFVYAMNDAGEELPLNITTELGKNWKGWMAMRELESNCRDEGGKSFMVNDDRYNHVQEGHTLILVDCAAVEEAWLELDKYFLSSKPVWDHKGIVELHPTKDGESETGHFYRGIRVGDFPHPFPYRVNVLADFSDRLTEDRTMPTEVPAMALCRALPMLTDADIMARVFPNDHYREGQVKNMAYTLGFEYYATDISDECLAYILELRNKNYFAVPKSLTELLISLGKLSKHESIRTTAPTVVQLKMLDRAKRFAKDLGYDSSTFGIYATYVADLGGTVMGMADRRGEKIYISPKCFDMGQKYVCTTWLEEYLHVHYGLEDMSRDLQSHLFDRIATLMEDHVYKDPI